MSGWFWVTVVAGAGARGVDAPSGVAASRTGSAWRPGNAPQVVARGGGGVAAARLGYSCGDVDARGGEVLTDGGQSGGHGRDALTDGGVEPGGDGRDVLTDGGECSPFGVVEVALAFLQLANLAEGEAQGVVRRVI